jgi:hypothetical protein
VGVQKNHTIPLGEKQGVKALRANPFLVSPSCWSCPCPLLRAPSLCWPWAHCLFPFCASLFTEVIVLKAHPDNQAELLLLRFVALPYKVIPSLLPSRDVFFACLLGVVFNPQWR